MNRKNVFKHVRKGHDVGYQEIGTDHRHLYVNLDERTIRVGKSVDFQDTGSRVYCYTCDRFLADPTVIDEWGWP